MLDGEAYALFLKYLPAPRANLFAGQAIPEIIAKRERVATQTIKDVLGRNENDLASVEKKIINIQRKFRANRRKKENLERLPYRYAHMRQEPDKPIGMTAEDAKQLLADANKPYKPQCEEKLASRIMGAAKKVELFSTVSHLTAASALESIFNDGLFGRQSMLQLYMPFKPASLYLSDIEDGDANVVCLGANAIDPNARHGIELQFDAKKIAENNPCVFYKQRDLGYDPKKIRSLRIGDLELYFSHTGTYRCQPSEVSSLVLFNGNSGGQYAWSKVTKAILIADNLEEMHQILTLNFFRFIDRLMSTDHSKSAYYKEQIYSALSTLNDQELIETLLEIGKKITDSMEFNFYGAYRINFSALLNIKNDDPPYTLNLPTFVSELQAGNIEKINEAKEKLPWIFNSYRFIDYLLSATNNETVISELQEQRKKCSIPSWMAESTVEKRSNDIPAATEVIPDQAQKNSEKPTEKTKPPKEKESQPAENHIQPTTKIASNQEPSFEAFKAAYLAQYQSEFFKKKSKINEAILKGEINTIEQIKKYAENKPHSRAAKVYNKLQKEKQKPTQDNEAPLRIKPRKK